MQQQQVIGNGLLNLPGDRWPCLWWSSSARRRRFKRITLGLRWSFRLLSGCWLQQIVDNIIGFLLSWKTLLDYLLADGFARRADNDERMENGKKIMVFMVRIWEVCNRAFPFLVVALFSYAPIHCCTTLLDWSVILNETNAFRWIRNPPTCAFAIEVSGWKGEKGVSVKDRRGSWVAAIVNFPRAEEMEW